MMKGYIPFLAVGKLFSIDENDQMMKEWFLWRLEVEFENGCFCIWLLEDENSAPIDNVSSVSVLATCIFSDEIQSQIFFFC
jgi:hypothetical protein